MEEQRCLAKVSEGDEGAVTDDKKAQATYTSNREGDVSVDMEFDGETFTITKHYGITRWMGKLSDGRKVVATTWWESRYAWRKKVITVLYVGDDKYLYTNKWIPWEDAHVETFVREPVIWHVGKEAEPGEWVPYDKSKGPPRKDIRVRVIMKVKEPESV